MRLLILFSFLSQIVYSQFAPPAGQAGTSAMYKDSSAFVAWASFCILQRGFQDISNTSGPYSTVGDSSKPIGIANNGVVSLGDGGTAVLTFTAPIKDGPGNDFAVFENSFSDDYLEFAFVEVSSDGINFFRFPATCNIQNTVQTGAFGLSDAKLVNNLAGKYRASYGTPFDLSEVQGIIGLDITHITHVKIIDVVGSINSSYATYDKNNSKINDPWPTAFGSSGFDLDAVGVINQTLNSVRENIKEESFSVYPNPASKAVGSIQLAVSSQIHAIDSELQITNLMGEEVFPSSYLISHVWQVDVSGLMAGVYFLHLKTKDRSLTKKIIISE